MSIFVNLCGQFPITTTLAPLVATSGLLVLALQRKNMASSAAASRYAKMPKVELHLHQDGACRVTTLQDLSRKYNLPYPHDDLQKFQEVVTLSKPQSSLKDFLKVFDALGNILRTREALERVAYEYCEDLAQQNVVYMECRFNPFPSAEVSPEDYIESTISGLRRGEKDFGIKSRSILSFMRHMPEKCPEVVQLAEKYRSWGVVGVDIAGDELMPLDQRHIDGFRRAKEMGLHITVHAGESGPAENVRQAIEVLGAERIGHGYHVIDDDSVYQLAKERGVHFEVCPTSSIFTNSTTIENHAVKRFAADGVSFSLSTDDPGVMQTDLSREFEMAEQSLGLGQQQLLKSVIDGAKAAFLPEKEKEELLQTVREKIAQFEREHQQKST